MVSCYSSSEQASGDAVLAAGDLRPSGRVIDMRRVTRETSLKSI